MPENEIRKPILPRNVEREVAGFKLPRHPFLAQGMLFGHRHRTKPKEEPVVQARIEMLTKQEEGEDQVKNLGNYFRLPWTDETSVPAILETIAHRQADAAGLADTTVWWLDAIVTSHLLIGTGLPNQMETGFLLHPLYGVPYIPGTAIKGVTQAALLAGWASEAGIGRLPFKDHQKIVNKVANVRHATTTPLLAFERLLFASAVRDDVWNRSVEETGLAQQAWGVDGPQQQILTTWAAGNGREKGRLFVKLFGAPALSYRGQGNTRHPHQGSRGRVTFHDAFPTVLRVGAAGQTSHAVPYYDAARNLFLPKKGNWQPPAPPDPDDHFNPVPFQFVAVGAGTSFRVTVGAKDADLAMAAKDAVTSVLRQDGVGAKRGIGFGRFEVTNVTRV